jgi:signal transduction histidine kinase
VAQAARQLTETHDVRLKLRLGDAPRLPADVEYNVLRIVQEAIANAVKHSSAGVIEVALEAAPQRLQVSVSDDGDGFRPHDREAASSGHYGLIGMRERASQIGGEFRLHSEPGRGTTVTLELPLVAATPLHQLAAETPPAEKRDAEPVE